MLLIGFLAILAIEYLGIDVHYLPVLRKLHFSLVFVVLLCLYAVAKYGLRQILAEAPVRALLIFTGLTALATFHGLVQSYAVDPLKQQLGYILLLVVGYHALRTVSAFRVFAITAVVLHIALVMINYDKFLQEQRAGAFKAGYFIGDGNDFSWSLTITFAWAMYLMLANKNYIWRLIGLAGGVMVVIGIIGAQSRGATLAFVASLLYFWVFISKKKMLGIIGLSVIALSVLVFAPEGYFTRMQTISAYEEDTSATNRLRMWGHAFEMAIDNPVLGVGAGSFNSAYGRYYRGDEDPSRWMSTHSVYFKVLAEYSFFGIAVFLGVIVLNLRQNWRTSRHLKERGPDAPLDPNVPEFVNMGIVAYSVAATFLTGVNYPHIFVLTAVTLAVKAMGYHEAESKKNASDDRIAKPEGQGLEPGKPI